MKVENVNSFVQGAQSTLSAICGEGGKLGKLFVKNPPYSPQDVSIVIGIVGELKGEVIFAMDTNCGLYLASRVMMGMNVPEMNDIAKSAISELANMISGNAAASLFSAGVTVDITPPVFIPSSETDKFNFVKPGDKVICLPLTLPSNQILEIGLHIS